MARRSITDRSLKSLKSAPKGTHYDVWDTKFPGFGVRVSDTGRKTFVLAARYGGARHPTRRALGVYGPLTLEAARKRASAWLALIGQGIDPAVEQERERQAALRKQSNTFASVAVEFGKYIRRIKLRTVGELEGMLWQKPIEEHRLRPEFKDWGPKPITDIASADVRTLLEKAVDRDAKYTAFKQFALVRRMFNWAIGVPQPGLETIGWAYSSGQR